MRQTSSHPPFLSILFSAFLFFLTACNNEEKRQDYVIGFSQCVESDAWRKTMLEEMKRELSFHPNVTFIVKDADGNSEKQINQVKELINKGVDLLIISPNEAAPLTPVVEETYRKGTPVVVVDRKIASPSYTAYVGGDNYNIGKMGGEYAVNVLKGKGNVLEITGLPKSTPAIERDRGFADALKAYPGITVERVNGEWYKEIAKEKLDSIAGTKPVDLLFAQNDMMASAAYEVYHGKGLPVPKIIGVDGLPCNGCGMQFVRDKWITATMLYPTGGEEAIQVAMQILNKENFNRENVIQTTVIDSTNVRYMQLQADKMSSQQQSIERQQNLLEDLKTITANQRTFLYVLVSSLVLALTFGGVLFFLFRQNRKINQQLQKQNNEILAQKKELEEMSAKAQVANEAKVAFFTNMSHEFRTPLTLILAPLEDLLADAKNNQRWNRNLNLIQKNVIRLLRLVNQLIDFRKIEVEKMRLRDTENDIIGFVNDILQSYQSIAQKRNIDLRLLTNERSLPVWFDVNMLDKVLFNLLSNAFKFTKDGGYIHLYVKRSEDGREAVIKVEDNGVGMEEEALKNTFNVFYQGEFENQKGSGLGLALSKEIIKLHKGTITVESEKQKGTTFTIRLPLGKEHLNEEELAETTDTPFVFYNDEKVYTSDLLTDLPKKELEGLKLEKESTILLIEDNEDLRTFLKERLKSRYEILEADNGQAALQQAFDVVPDLIISDVIIPGKDGMALINIFKSDVRTSHIPVIMLTGKANMEHQIEGMKSRADAYITKPFSVEYLEQTVQSLLANRATLKEHFTADISSKLKTQTVGKLDRKFVNDFTAIVESNLANENFSVEDICKEMGISRVQLYRKAKALLNINANDYILNTRLQKAKYLLQHEDLSISEVAYKVGFSSPAYFSTVFKSKFGVTPKAFKEK
ncbi:MAG TPA: substrate-binding domain-containing protein [Flavisolibacter sp.]|nr:substrate-binding domain-containing protein [Flavisolibacter sp.]